MISTLCRCPIEGFQGTRRRDQKYYRYISSDEESLCDDPTFPSSTIENGYFSLQKILRPTLIFSIILFESQYVIWIMSIRALVLDYQ